MNHTSRLPTIIALTLLTAVTQTVEANPQKAEVCHVPPGNPGNAHTISVNENAVPAHLAHGDIVGACPRTASEMDPPNVTIDLALLTEPIQIAGVDGGDMRNVARMNSEIGEGYQFDFVENEIYLITDQPDDLVALQSRTGATVLFEIRLPGMAPGGGPMSIYLLKVDPAAADTTALNATLAVLSPDLHGEHQVSSEAALKLLALVANEASDHGLRVGINFLLRSQDFSERSTVEAQNGVTISAGPLNFVYTGNGFEWPYMERDPDVPGDGLWPLDTGVAEAIRVVEAEWGGFNLIRAMIADGGFYPNEDFPPYVAVGPMRIPNPDPTRCGSAGAISPTCSAHGTHTTLAGFGVPDNEFGTFGPGGNVGDLVLLQSPSVDFESIARFIIDAIPAALALRPRIINVSATTAVAGGWCFAVCEPLDIVAGYINRQGILFVAAAGNQGANVDATDVVCVFFCVRFEEAAFIPCETDHVICVGAHTALRSVRAPYSNFGTYTDANTVDIFAPGDQYSVVALSADETATPVVDDLQIINGTSFATPFTAGILALAWSADPGQSHSDVLDCVMSSAHANSLTGEPRRVNALGAVQCAMGGTYPFVEIVTPADGAQFTRGTESVELRANADDLEDGSALTIAWFSSLQGALGSSTPGSNRNLGPFGLQVGTHEICAGVTDSSSRSLQDCIEIEIRSAAPVAEIFQPSFGDEFVASANIVLSGSARDPDGPTPTDIRWYMDRYGEPTSTIPAVTGTLSASIPASTYGPGDYRITLYVEDDSGAFSIDDVDFAIVDDPSNALPTITISRPAPGFEYFSTDGGPVTIPLVAVAEDAEDGVIAFDQIDWYVSTNGGAEQPLAVNSAVICIEFDPFGICVRFATQYSIELGPEGSDTRTRHDIKGRVTDSDGQENSNSNGRTTIFVLQLI
jgi:subtilisin family serine protease